jgi:hypothetical protein
MLEGHVNHSSTLTARRDDPLETPAVAPKRSARSARVAAVRWLSFGAAVLVATGGYVHYCLYRNGYRAIPVIGPGFLIQVIGSAAIAVALVVPWRELRISHWVIHPATEVRLGALALSAGTLIAFGLTRRPGGLFHFQERGFQPAPQALIALVAESGALILVTAALVLDWLGSRRSPSRLLPSGPPVQALVRVPRR